MLTQEHLKSVINYNPDNGVFTWIKTKKFSDKKAGDRAGGFRKDGYHTIYIEYKKYLSHRLAWLYMKGEFPKNCIDHINGVTSDNRWVNIRAATLKENQANRKTSSNNKTGVKGVSLIRGSIWRASVYADGKSFNVGCFSNLEDASRAVKKKREELHGEFHNHG